MKGQYILVAFGRRKDNSKFDYIVYEKLMENKTEIVVQTSKFNDKISEIFIFDDDFRIDIVEIFKKGK